jgi:hypothetical protein
MPTIALPHRTCTTSPASIVQLEYPSSDSTGPVPLPKPDSGGHWTRFVLLSDTHTKRCDVPDGDVLLHSGDLTERGTLKELRSTMEWLYALPHRVKMYVAWMYTRGENANEGVTRIIAGNHDSAVHREWYEENWKELFLYRSNDAPEVRFNL